MRSKIMKVPTEVYDYFKRRKQENKSYSMTTDMSLFFKKFHKLRAMEKKLQGKKVLVFK